MSRSKNDPELRAHKEWLGLLQPVGLVVSPLALVRKQAVIDRDGAVHLQAQLRELVDDTESGEPPVLRDLLSLLEDVLGWPPDECCGGDPDSGLETLPIALEVRLPELDELLRPTYALRDLASEQLSEDNNPGDDTPPAWLLLVEDLPARTPLDDKPKDSGRGWHVSPQAKFERMLKELGVPIGLLSNGETLRLVYAPRGETSGHLSFPIGAMCEVANRPMLGALYMLLSADRLLGEADKRRLPALLEESRKYQNEVSTQLAEQVLGALIELLRGFQAADETAGGQLLRDGAGNDPKHVYGGLLTVLLRLVFLLYAEDRGLLPDDQTWAGNYSVVGLFERLREDAGRYPDTMDQRYGAWAWLLTLFRLVFLGGGHGPSLHLPARKGQLFDPNEYAFLEGRIRGEGFEPGERLEPPRVSDGTIARVLRGLLILDGERLSYRSLDVEQIGSVYESMMGYEVERAVGSSIGLGKKHIVVNLDALLEQKPGDRKKWLKEQAEVDASGGALKGLKEAQMPEDVVAALQRRVSKRTPTILPAGSLYLQPGEERRRTGSHYTPRSLTEPIVRTTLRPVLEDLVTDGGGTPTEGQILALKVCDPAMGSGAFLVEACRQLAEQLKRAWDVHGTTRVIPADEEPLLHARRLVAEHCLYGVDKNPFAVNLAKLSLWLATLAKEHPFTFLDHALKCGDSLVGLTRKQIAEFRWDEEVADDGPLFARVREQVGAAVAARLKIHEASEDADAEKRMWNEEAERALDDARLQGDAVIAAFFAEGKAKDREKRRVQLWDTVQRWHGGDVGAKGELMEAVRELREDQGVVPFHWEIEFPEVFGRGFDLFSGNPPFLGGKRISTSLGDEYKEWLRNANVQTSSNTDLSAHFFRRVFGRLAGAGTIGLVATNTIAQGDTREGGLMHIAQHGGTIYRARTRLRWPGLAAVIVSIVWIRKNATVGRKFLDNHPVDRISAYLMSSGPDDSPLTLAQNAGLSHIGCDIKGEGFTFEDNSVRATDLSTMRQLVEGDARNAERIFPYVGGAEINDDPGSRRIRYVINFGSMSLEAASSWPELLAIAAEKVKPERIHRPGAVKRCPWWQFWRPRPALWAALAPLEKVLASSQTAKYRCFDFSPARTTFSHKAVVITCDKYGMFAMLQCRCHESWSLFLGSSMKDDPVYTPSDCFETFPFPKDWQTSHPLEQAGQTYYDYRAALMIRNDEGLTKTYNRFHNPDEDDPEIIKLRDLHAAMDRAVLEAYGWQDLAERATCEFRLEYEEPEDDEDDTPRKRKKKKPWRYKWPQDFHDEVLARLLELNQTYAEQERLAGEGPASKKKGKPKKKRGKKRASKKKTAKKKQPVQVSLLGDDDDIA